MPSLRIHWNYIRTNEAVDLRAYSAQASSSEQLSVQHKTIGPGCKGVLFRASVRDEVNFSQYLTEMKLDEVRRARNEPDNSLLFKPKCPQEQSIGTLKIVRPKRFAKKTSLQRPSVSGQGVSTSGFPVSPDVQRVTEFEVLLESTEFILEDIQEQMAERFQLQETFGDFNVFFFGKRAEIFSYSGSLINAKGNLQWRNQFLESYENFLRGTKCAELKARAYLLYDDVVREGFILSAAMSQNATVEGVVKFNFTMLITGKKTLGEVPKIRSGIETRSAKASNKFSGITNIEFVRASDLSGLPGVGRDRFVADLSIAEGSKIISNFSMTQDDGIPGNDAPSDLKELMLNRSVDAYQKLSGSFDVGQVGETADFDVLFDFINAKTLSGLKTTASVIAGARSSDVDNLSGEVLVAKLLSQPGFTVDNLKLQDAVRAAESFVRNHRASIQDLAPRLEKLGQYFSPNSTVRTKVLTQGNFQELLRPPQASPEADTYVLLESRDKEFLPTLISGTNALLGFDGASTSKLVVSNAKVTAVNTFLEGADKTKKNAADAIQFYAAVFCLVGRPDFGSPLYPTVSQKFPNVGNLGGKSNALLFVQDQTISAFRDVLKSLPTQVEQDISSTLSAVQASWPIALAVSRASVQADSVPLNEGVLAASLQSSPVPAVGTPTSSPVVDYVLQISVYLNSLLAETGIVSTVAPVSSDAFGGTIAKDVQDVAETYLTPAYRQSLVVGSNQDPDDTIVSFGPSLTPILNQPAKVGAARYYFVPCGFPVSRFVGHAEVPPTTTVSAGTVGGLVTINPISQSGTFIVSSDTPGLSDEDKALLSVGIVRVEFGQLNAFPTTPKPPQKAAVYVQTRKRAGTQIVAGSTSIDSSPPGGGFFYKGGRVSSALRLEIPTFRRGYRGSPTAYVQPFSFSIKNGAVGLGNFARNSVDAVIDATERALAEIIRDPAAKLPNVEAQRNRVLEELALSKFQSLQPISLLKTQLEFTGITVDNYLDLAFAAQRQKFAAQQLVDLREALDKATKLLKESQNSPAELVEASDAAYRENLCG